MKLLPQHWLLIVIVLFIGYWLGERYGGALKGIPVVGQFT
jgi:hypothetical protein